MQVEINVFLIEVGHSDAVLVDAGVTEYEYPQLLLGALRRALKPARTLRLVLCTHGHRVSVSQLAGSAC